MLGRVAFDDPEEEGGVAEVLQVAGYGDEELFAEADALVGFGDVEGYEFGFVGEVAAGLFGAACGEGYYIAAYIFGYVCEFAAVGVGQALLPTGYTGVELEVVEEVVGDEAAIGVAPAFHVDAGYGGDVGWGRGADVHSGGCPVNVVFAKVILVHPRVPGEVLKIDRKVGWLVTLSGNE
jgi:hypothetical protein